MGTRSVHMTDVFVGIDVSKATLDVMVLPEERYFQVSRDEAGVEQLLATLKPLGVTLIVLEATGGLERPVVMALAAAGDRKSTRLNSSHVRISYAVFCLKK